MATWKKVAVSGSDISQFNNDSNYLISGDSGITLSGSFSGSFEGDGSGLTGLATNLDISGSTGNTSVDLLTQDFTIASGNSISTEATAQTVTVAVTDGGIGETQLGTGAVTEAKIGTGAVTTTKIGSNAVTTAKIAGGNVTNAKLENSSVLIGDQTITLGDPATTTLSGLTASGSFSGSFEGEFSGVLADGTTATTQASGDNSTKVATTAYVDNVAGAADLNITGSGGTTTDIDLDSQALTFTGNDGLQLSASAQTITATIADGGIANAKLENDSVTIGSTEITLGAVATTTVDGLTLTGATASGSFSGSFEGDGSGLTGIGTVTGTGVNNQVATWSGTDSIDGSANFTYDGTTLTVGSKATIGTNNLNTGTLSTIAGGTLNTGSENCVFIGGGSNNSISGGYGTHGVIVGGTNNSLSDSYCGFIGGGSGNSLEGSNTGQVIVGGCNNTVVGADSGILGGRDNCINSHGDSFIIGSNLTSTADCTTYVNNLDVEGSITGSSFTGSFVGDGSGLTGVSAQVEESLLFSDGLSGGTFDGTAAVTASINLDGSTLEVGASGLKVSSSGITETELNASVAGTGLSGGAGTSLNLDLTEVISTDGANRILTSDGDGTLTAEPNFTFDGSDLTVTGNALVTGDLTVQGTASFQHTEELQVADRFILMASGSSTAGDGGIVIQQGTQNIGEVFGFDSATTRFGLTGSFDASATAFTPDAFMAAVVEGTDDIPGNAPARYQAKGNIFVGTTEGEIWIYG